MVDNEFILKTWGGDTLHRVNNNSDSALIQSFEWLLRVDINSYVFSNIQLLSLPYVYKVVHS